MLSLHLRSFSALAVVALSLLIATDVSADEAPERRERRVLFALSYPEDVANGCGDESQLARLIEERLARPVFVEDTEEADVVLSIRKGAGEEVVIVASDHDGHELGRRNITLGGAAKEEGCPKTLDTLAVVLAILVGPERMTSAPPRPPSIKPEAPVAQKRDQPPPAVVAKSEEPLRWLVSPMVGGSLGTGVLPGLAWSIEAGAIVRPPLKDISLIARAYYWPAQSTGTPPPADVDRVGGSLFGCLELFHMAPRTGLGLAGCTGIDVSRIEATSKDLTRASDTSVVVALGLEVRVGYRIALNRGASVSLEPFVAPQISAILRRDRFTYRDPNDPTRELTLLQPSVVAFSGAFGLALHFL